MASQWLYGSPFVQGSKNREIENQHNSEPGDDPICLWEVQSPVIISVPSTYILDLFLFFLIYFVIYIFINTVVIAALRFEPRTVWMSCKCFIH